MKKNYFGWNSDKPYKYQHKIGTLGVITSSEGTEETIGLTGEIKKYIKEKKIEEEQ